MSPFAMAAALCFAISTATALPMSTLWRALVAQILEELGAQVAKEDEERHRAIEEARKAESAFNSSCSRWQRYTGSTSASWQGYGYESPISRKVLCLNSTTKKVTVSSYTNTPISSRPPSPIPEEPRRIPPLPREVSYVKQPPDLVHPWKDVQFPNLQYISPPKDLNTRSRQRQERDGGY
ncbi:hypothetical protein EDC04DRAFT_2603031 [Pisolithus marmoratus]|nr:hypothetical protein EDC04DRAFT_2603031 [Pisolithus marmoratus]